MNRWVWLVVLGILGTGTGTWLLARTLGRETSGPGYLHAISLREICSRGIRLEQQLQTIRARIRAKMDLAGCFLAGKVSTGVMVEKLVAINREIPGYQDHVQEGFPGFSDEEIARWQVPGLVREALQMAGADQEARARADQQLRAGGLLP